jgi:hypothetical protein
LHYSIMRLGHESIAEILCSLCRYQARPYSWLLLHWII